MTPALERNYSIYCETNMPIDEAGIAHSIGMSHARMRRGIMYPSIHSSNFSKAMQPLVRAVQRATRGMLEFQYCVAKRLYLQHHDRLPGSERTARLRKKRRTKVLKWHNNWMKQFYEG